MVSRAINFRIGDAAYEILLTHARPDETASKVAQRLLTELLTGSEELGLGVGGRPPERGSIIKLRRWKP